MGDSGSRITRIELPDGTPVWARISGAEELTGPGPGGGPTYTDTGFGDFADQVQARVESLHSVVTGVARSLAVPLRAVRPDEVSVEFGIELTAKAGKIVGLLADGEAKGAITVTLTWNGGGPPIELTAKAGKIVGLLADGEAKGAITVTLTWNGGGPPIELTAKAGKIVGLLADGEAKGAITVTLT
ncbi:CU044_2847 family protein, partial [Streptomyces sp. SID2563]|uniref:CU044_2847 family protein n=1 Tax=Streptomyces sp. SID2563 TaxID=2690255 RepID=UPI001F20EA5F